MTVNGKEQRVAVHATRRGQDAHIERNRGSSPTVAIRRLPQRATQGTMKVFGQIVGGGFVESDARRVVAGQPYGVMRVRSACQPLIGVDCDGVLASDRLLWQRMRTHFPQHIPARYEDLKTFEWPRVTAETHALCQELSADPNFALRLTPMPGAIQAIRRLSHRGYRIVMITARPTCVHDATRAWLLAQGISDCIDEIYCVSGGPAKPSLALEVGCLAFVEDNHATAEAMSAAGLRSYLLDAPYNRMFTRRSVRVADWQALVADLMLRIPVRQPTLRVKAPTMQPVKDEVLASPLSASQALPEGALAS